MNITLQKIDAGETKPVTGLTLFHRANEVHLLLSRKAELSETSALPHTGPMQLAPAGELGDGRAWDAKPAAGPGFLPGPPPREARIRPSEKSPRASLFQKLDIGILTSSIAGCRLAVKVKEATRGDAQKKGFSR